MILYYVNNNRTTNPGLHHEVHTEEHAAQLNIQDKTKLGYFDNEIQAVEAAKRFTPMPMVVQFVVPRHILVKMRMSLGYLSGISFYSLKSV